MQLLNLESLAEKTSPEFAEIVRTELEWHTKGNHKMFVIDFTCKSRSNERFDNVSEAVLLVKASTMCYRFSWTLLERQGQGRQYHQVHWMGMGDIEKFADSDQRVGV